MVDFAPPFQPPSPVLLAKLRLSCSSYYDNIQLWRQTEKTMPWDNGCEPNEDKEPGGDN